MCEVGKPAAVEDLTLRPIGSREVKLQLPASAVRTVDDGKLKKGWVEQASFELYHWLLAK